MEFLGEYRADRTEMRGALATLTRSIHTLSVYVLCDSARIHEMRADILAMRADLRDFRKGGTRPTGSSSGPASGPPTPSAG